MWLAPPPVLYPLPPMISALFLVSLAGLQSGTQAPNPAPTPTPAAPDPQDPQANQPAGLYGAGKGLELTLEGAWEIALQQNLGFASEVLNTDLALYNYRGSYGTFDWLFHAGAGLVDTK